MILDHKTCAQQHSMAASLMDTLPDTCWLPWMIFKLLITFKQGWGAVVLWAYSSSNKSHGAKGRGIESRSFCLFIVYIYIYTFKSVSCGQRLTTQRNDLMEA